jgi:hypothetical protein
MIAAPRQSILSRPIRKNAPLRNTENIDVEYEHSQARLHAKQQRYQEQEDYRRRCLEGTREEKVHLQEERRQEMQEAVTWKSSRKLQEKAHDKTVVDRSMQRQEYCQDAEKSAEAQKREYLKSVMEENKRLAEERRREADRRKVADQERERQEVSFWDRTPRSFR